MRERFRSFAGRVARAALGVFHDRGYLAVRQYLSYMKTFRRPAHILKPQRFSEFALVRRVKGPSKRLLTTKSKLETKAYARSLPLKATLTVPTAWSGHDLSELKSVPNLPANWVLKPDRGGSSRGVILGRGPVTDDVIAEAGEYEQGDSWWGEQPAVEWLVEPNISESNAYPIDYKFFVFHGIVAFVEAVIRDGRGNKWFTILDNKWNELPVIAWDSGIRREPVPNLERPPRLAEMLADAATLGAGFDFIRVDLYNQQGMIYLGELEANPDAQAMHQSDPDDFDLWLGYRWQSPANILSYQAWQQRRKK